MQSLDAYTVSIELGNNGKTGEVIKRDSLPVVLGLDADVLVFGTETSFMRNTHAHINPTICLQSEAALKDDRENNRSISSNQFFREKAVVPKRRRYVPLLWG